MAGRALAAISIVWALAVVGVLGDGSQPVDTSAGRAAVIPAESPAGRDPSPSAQAAPHSAIDVFQTADTCMVCHNNLVTPAGMDVSIGSDWRATMMANSARDPYWMAAVRREIMDHPDAQAEIEDECSICHMPMATYAARAAGGKGEIFARLEGAGEPEDLLAADGVSCAACHQITSEKLGTPESFTGGYVIDVTRADGDRPMYGPFETDAGRAAVMRSAVGFVPVEGAHLSSSGMCATCHTLFTSALGPGHQVLGRLPEQVPYLEWEHSAYRESRSCQSCHMPIVTEAVPVTGVLGQPRTEVSRHVFLGGNFFMMRILNRFRAELGVVASPREMELSIARTVDHLQRDTAEIAIESLTSAAGELAFDVIVRNRAGHKFPTAYPSRRAWLHVTVRDAAGRALFESGALQPDGSIAGNANDADPAQFEPHYTRIDRPDQVQVYEVIMVGQDGRPTTGLLTGVRYVKDNRLLPAGFDKATASGDVAVHGGAMDDGNFVAGLDRVRYAVALGNARGPLSVSAELIYQPIGYRWAENFRDYDAPETRRFVRYYEAMSGVSAVAVAGAER